MRSPLTVLVLVLAAGAAVLAYDAQTPADPCEEPLGWRVGRVEPGSDIDPERFRRMIRDAARMWNDAAGRTLFVHDPEAGFPVHLAVQGAQAQAGRLEQAVGEMDDLGAELETRRRAIEREREVLEGAMDAYQRRLEALNRRVERHREKVRAHRQGEAGAPSAEALRREAEELERARRALDERRAELQSRQAELNRAIDEYNRLSRRRNETADAIQRTQRRARNDPGEYRERRGMNLFGTTVDIEREIYVYFFYNRRHLELVLVHELGHALGLEHVADEDAVMHASYEAMKAIRAESMPPVELTRADVRALEAVCP